MPVSLEPAARCSARSRHSSPFLDKRRCETYFRVMSDVAEPLIVPDQEKETSTKDELEPGYLVVCWNDPVNLMDYVTHVFQKVFGWDRQKAERHMMEVHMKGKSVLARESLERAEFHVHRLQSYTLHATMERDA